MTRPRPFLRTSAVAAGASAFTTLGLIFLSRWFTPVTDPVLAVERANDPVYLLRLVVGLVHPALVLTAVGGVALLRRRVRPGASLAGLVFMTVWATTEAVQQSLLLVAGHWTWRAALATATDGAVRDRMAAYLVALDGASDALFLVILGAFVVGNVALAIAVWDRSALGRVVAVGFALAAGLGVVSGLTAFGGGLLPAPVMAVLYPLLQPPARFLTGVWLWREAGAPAIPSGSSALPS